MQATGLYRGRAHTWGLGKAGTGTPQWVLGLTVSEIARDEYDPRAGFESLQDDKGEPAPLKRQVFMAITPGTKNMVEANLKALGYTGPLKSSRLNPGNPDSFDFAKADILVTCSHDNYQGRDREKWELARQMRSQMTREDQDQFDQMFGEVSYRELQTVSASEVGQVPSEVTAPPSKTKSS